MISEMRSVRIRILVLFGHDFLSLRERGCVCVCTVNTGGHFCTILIHFESRKKPCSLGWKNVCVFQTHWHKGSVSHVMFAQWKTDPSYISSHASSQRINCRRIKQDFPPPSLLLMSCLFSRKVIP